MQKITIIISAQDSTEKLDGCLDSIANQDLQDIEIICLLNGSKDDAPLALEAYSDCGTRLVPVFCDESLDRMHAKKAGVDQAFGEYILFLDGNCRLQPWACSELYEKIRDCEADILQFSTEEENAGGPVYYNTPYYGTLLNKDITEACFVEQRYRYSLWDKLFSAELVKKAFSHIGADCPIENDCFPYFYLSFFARRFCGYIGESCCRYLEHGHMRSEPNLGMLERFCSQVKVAKSLEIFLKDQGQYDEYEGAQKAIGENVVNTCIEKWHECLPMELFAGGFDMLVDCCGVEKTISGLASKYWDKRVEIAGRIRGGRALNAKPTRLKTIVIHYFRYCFGGVGRVISALIPMWIDMGYRVILLTDTPPTEIDYPLDPRSERIVLHDVKSNNRDEYALRARQWSDILEKYRVDAVMYLAWHSDLLLWDLCCVKCRGIPFVICTHSVFSYFLNRMGREFGQLSPVYRLTDAVVSLSEADRSYWSHFAPRSFYVPNPVNEELQHVKPSPLDSPIILWIGRFTWEKKLTEAMDIFAGVLREVPDAKLWIVGSPMDPGKMEHYYERCEKLGLADSVVFWGQQKDVSPFYAQASVHLMTSVFEGYGMVLLESRAYGLPAVVYDIPYLEMQRDGRGIRRIPQGDRESAAHAIAELLRNDDLRRQMGREARECFQSCLDFDLRAAWENVFTGLMAPADPEDLPTETERIMMETIVSHYRYGWRNRLSKLERVEKKLKKDIADLKKVISLLTDVNLDIEKQRELVIKNKRLKKALKKIRNSQSYRIGRMITWLPRKTHRWLGGVKRRQKDGAGKPAAKAALPENIQGETQKTDSALKDRRTLLFVCGTVYQLMVAINIRLTLCEGETADLLLYDATDWSLLLPRIRELALFRKTEICVVNKHLVRLERSDARAYTSDDSEALFSSVFREDTLSLEYTDVYLPLSLEPAAVYEHLLSKGLKVKAHIFEEGIGAYWMNIKQRLNAYRFVYSRHDRSLHIDRHISELLLLYPQFYVGTPLPFPVNPVPSMKADPRVYDAFQKVFGKPPALSEPFIFLEQAHVGSPVNYTWDDFYVVEQIAKIIGKDNLLVKLHPRSRVDRFTPAGYRLMQARVYPWEMYFSSGNLGAKVLITVSSGVALTSLMLSDRQIRIVCLANVVRSSKSGNRETWPAKFQELLLKDCNKDDKVLFLPKNEEALNETVRYLLGAIDKGQCGRT